MTSRSGMWRHRARADWRQKNPGAPRMRLLTPEDAAAAAGVGGLQYEIEQLRARAESLRDDRELAREQAELWLLIAAELGREACRIEGLAKGLEAHAPGAPADADADG